MFLWLVLFLLDVAMRRVVLDFRAMGRRVVSLVRLGKRERKVDPTLERLRARRQKLREQLSAGKAAAIAARRYKGGEAFRGDLPVAKVAEPVKQVPMSKTEKPTPAKTSALDESSHIQRLLKAKRKAAGLDQNDTNE
jgi:hypothetical protein